MTLSSKTYNCQNSVINPLRFSNATSYSPGVAAKSATGRRNPCNLKATRHAPCVFFYVVAMAHLFQVRCFVAVFCQLRRIIKIMVARAGQSSDWPVSFRAGIPTPVRATTHECRNSGGSVNRYLKEIATMAIIPGYSYQKYVDSFLSALFMHPLTSVVIELVKTPHRTHLNTVPSFILIPESQHVCCLHIRGNYYD